MAGDLAGESLGDLDSDSPPLLGVFFGVLERPRRLRPDFVGVAETDRARVLLPRFFFGVRYGEETEPRLCDRDPEADPDRDSDAWWPRPVEERGRDCGLDRLRMPPAGGADAADGPGRFSRSRDDCTR